MQTKRLYHKVLKDGGITLTPRLVQVKKQAGFFVSLKDQDAIIDLKDFTPDSLNRAVNKLSPYLLGDRLIGIWLDKANEKVYIDVSVWILDRDEAVQKGLLGDQIAIWDIENGREIYLK